MRAKGDASYGPMKVREEWAIKEIGSHLTKCPLKPD